MNSIQNIFFKTAIFRCDASSEIGSGHVMRCLTLAEALKACGWTCEFITIDESAFIVPALARSGFEVFPVDYIPETADLLVVDHYELDCAYEEKARGWARSIMVIDDLADRNHDCNILLDQTYGRAAQDYKSLVPADCLILCGSDYMLLRPQFYQRREAAESMRQDVERVDRVLVSFGATNPDNIVQKVLSVLADFKDRDLSVDVVLSAKDSSVEALQQQIANMAQTTSHSVQLHLDVEDMAEFILNADLAIGGGGTTSWERACLGLPTLMIVLADNQRLVAQNLADLGAVKLVGDVTSIREADIDKAFETMRDNGGALKSMSEQAFLVCDGQGASTLSTIIDKIAGKEPT